MDSLSGELDEGVGRAGSTAVRFSIFCAHGFWWGEGWVFIGRGRFIKSLLHFHLAERLGGVQGFEVGIA